MMSATKYEHFEDPPMADEQKPAPQEKPICMVARSEISEVRAQTYSARPYETTAGRSVVAIVASAAGIPVVAPEPAAPTQALMPAAPVSDAKQVTPPKS